MVIHVFDDAQAFTIAVQGIGAIATNRTATLTVKISKSVQQYFETCFDELDPTGDRKSAYLAGLIDAAIQNIGEQGQIITNEAIRPSEREERNN
jgi:hypothetical protein